MKLEGAGEVYARTNGEMNKAFFPSQTSLHGRHTMSFAYLIGHDHLHDAVQQSHCAPVTANGVLRLVCRDHGDDNPDRLLAQVHVCRLEYPDPAIYGTARRCIPCIAFTVLTVYAWSPCGGSYHQCLSSMP